MQLLTAGTLVAAATFASTRPTVSTSDHLPRWVGTPLPNATLPHSGLPLLPDRRQVTVYNTTNKDGSNNTMGLYNHGPMVIYAFNVFLCAWYNAPLSESHDMRVLLAASPDLSPGSWSSTPEVLFPSLNSKGEENEPFPEVNGRLYGAAADEKWNNTHDSGVRGAMLMRRILSPTEFGPIFWLADAVPPAAVSPVAYPLYTSNTLDAETRADAAQYLTTLVNETVVVPANGPDFNERSLYSLPKKKSGTSDLVLLLRTGGHQHGSKALPQLWASRCTVPSGGNGGAGSTGGMLLGGEAQKTLSNLSTFSCKSGTGSFEYKEPSLAQHGGDASAVTANAGNTNIGASSSSSSNSNLNCNWSVPEMTNIPDAPSRTCAGHLPNNGGIGLIGNNGGHGSPFGDRDPLTFLIAADGIHYSTHWVVESGAPVPKWKSLGHPQGWQYPSFMWCTDGCGGTVDTIVFSYSVSKEDIVLTIAPLSSLGLQ